MDFYAPGPRQRVSLAPIPYAPLFTRLQHIAASRQSAVQHAFGRCWTGVCPSAPMSRTGGHYSVSRASSRICTPIA
jgi:hypothetical protein